jgi:hypothetical protein
MKRLGILTERLRALHGSWPAGCECANTGGDHFEPACFRAVRGSHLQQLCRTGIIAGGSRDLWGDEPAGQAAHAGDGVAHRPGASRSQGVRLVLKQGLALATAGLILGVGCAWSVARLMQSTLYGAGSPYLATLAVVGAVLLCAALVACLISALRAARVQPMAALRND